MICNQCGENHLGHCSRVVKQLREENINLHLHISALAAQIHNLTKSNKTIESNESLTSKTLTKSNGFDKTAYQREYMRRRRLNGCS